MLVWSSIFNLDIFVFDSCYDDKTLGVLRFKRDVLTRVEIWLYSGIKNVSLLGNQSIHHLIYGFIGSAFSNILSTE